MQLEDIQVLPVEAEDFDGVSRAAAVTVIDVQPSPTWSWRQWLPISSARTSTHLTLLRPVHEGILRDTRG